MILQHIKLSNFMSFDSDVNIDFSKCKSLTLVTGTIDQSDQSNGAGKSSLFESVYWCLTGKTIRKIKASDVVNHKSKHTQVVLTFLHDNKQITVDRYWSAQKKIVIVIVDGEKNEFHDSKQATAYIYDLLKINQDIFALLSFYGKNFTHFSTLSPSEKAGIFELIVEGDKWEFARDNAVRQAKQCKDSIMLAEALIGSNKDDITLLQVKQHVLAEKIKDEQELFTLQVDAKQAVIDNFVKRHAKSGSTHATAIKQQADQYINQAKNADQVKDKIGNGYDDQIDQIRQQLKQIATDTAATLQGHSDDLSTTESQKAVVLSDLKKIKAQVVLNTCLTCGQPVSADHIQSLDQTAEHLQSALTGHDKAIQYLRDEVKTAKNRKVATDILLEGQINTLKSEKIEKIEAVNQSVKFYKHKIHLLDRWFNAKEAIKNNIESLSHDLEVFQLKSTLSHLKSQAADIKDEITRKQSVIDDKISEVVKDKKSLLHAEYWIQGFKDIKFSLFDSVVDSFTQCLKSFVEAQNLDIDSVEVDTWKSLTTGKTVPEIGIYVVRDGVRLNLNALSEGETQRMNIACFLSINMLINMRLGFNLGFIVLDEPLSGLDADGKQCVFNIVSELSNNTQVFVIDHDANFANLFPSTLKILKTGGVSTIIQ